MTRGVGDRIDHPLDAAVSGHHQRGPTDTGRRPSSDERGQIQRFDQAVFMVSEERKWQMFTRREGRLLLRRLRAAAPHRRPAPPPPQRRARRPRHGSRTTRRAAARKRQPSFRKRLTRHACRCIQEHHVHAVSATTSSDPSVPGGQLYPGDRRPDAQVVIRAIVVRVSGPQKPDDIGQPRPPIGRVRLRQRPSWRPGWRLRAALPGRTRSEVELICAIARLWRWVSGGGRESNPPDRLSRSHRF